MAMPNSASEPGSGNVIRGGLPGTGVFVQTSPVAVHPLVVLLKQMSTAKKLSLDSLVATKLVSKTLSTVKLNEPKKGLLPPGPQAPPAQRMEYIQLPDPSACVKEGRLVEKVNPGVRPVTERLGKPMILNRSGSPAPVSMKPFPALSATVTRTFAPVCCSVTLPKGPLPQQLDASREYMRVAAAGVAQAKPSNAHAAA